MLTELRKSGADLDRLKSDRQRRFCLEYLISHKPKEAAVKAGYKANHADVTAAKLLKNPIIKAFLGKMERLDVEKLELDRLVVLKRLYEALTYEARDFCDDEGMPLLPHQLPDRVQRQVDGVEWEIEEAVDDEGYATKKTKVKYKLTPRAIAREQAMKHKGLFAPDRVLVGEGLFADWDALRGDGRDEPDQIENAIETKFIEKEDE